MSDPKLPRIADASGRTPQAPEPAPATDATAGASTIRRAAAPAGAPATIPAGAPAGTGAAPSGGAGPGAEARMPRSPLFTPRVFDATPSAGEPAAGPAPAAPAAPSPAPKAVGGSPPPAGAVRPAPEAASRPAAEIAPLEERLKPRGPLAPIGMSDRGRFIVATLFGIVLALGVHIAIVLALPRFAENDAFSRLRSTMEAGNAVPIAAPGGTDTWVPLPDPAAAVAACAYDLREGPVRIAAKTGALFQSLSFHARGGGVYFAVTDRAAVRGELDLVVMTRRQLDEALAAEDEADPTRDVRIVAPRPEGFVIVRVLAPSPSLRSQAEEAARTVACTIEGDDDPAAPPAPAPAPPAAAPPAPPPSASPPPQPARPAGPTSPPARR